MIPLPTQAPTTATELEHALNQLLASVLTLRATPVRVEGQYPALARLHINLSQATPALSAHPQWLTTGQSIISECLADTLEVVGQPFGDAARPIDLHITARQFKAQFLSAESGCVLKLAAASQGKFKAAITRASLQRILLTESSKVAKSQGVDIKDVQINWTSTSPRHLALEILIKAKKGIFPTANLKIKGQLTITDQLTATLSSLSVEGEGIAGGIGAGILRPKLIQAEGKSFPLLTLPLDNLKLQDIRIVPLSDSLSVEANFAG